MVAQATAGGRWAFRMASTGESLGYSGQLAQPGAASSGPNCGFNREVGTMTKFFLQRLKWLLSAASAAGTFMFVLVLEAQY